MITFRKLIFWPHLICGIAMGLVVFAMSFTGVVLTYEKQMIRWADGFDVQPPSLETPRIGPTARLSKVLAETGKRPTGVQFRSDRAEPARVYFGRESVAVNPYTGAALGDSAVGVRGFFRTMIVWHRWLGQEGDGRAVGKAITGACNLGFLFMIVTGSYLWWPKIWTWKQLRPVVFFRRGLPAKARDFNWHNVFGLWCAIPLFLVAATGTFFSYSWTSDILYALTGEQRPLGGSRGPGGSSGKSVQAPDFNDLDELFEKAMQVEPDWMIATVRLAENPEAPVAFSMDRGNGFRPDLRSTVVLHRGTGEVVKRETYADMGKAQSARTWIRWLHTGEAGGWAGQTLAGIASLAGCFLVYTGWMLSWRRFRAWRERLLQARSDAPPPSARAGRFPPLPGAPEAGPRPSVNGSRAMPSPARVTSEISAPRS